MSRLWPPAHGWNRNKPTAQLPAVSPLIPTTHTIPPMPPSVQILQPFPSTLHGPGQPHKIAMDLDPMYKREWQISWGHNAQCQIHTVFLCIQLFAFVVVKTRCHWRCNTKPMPAKGKIGYNTKNCPIKLQKRYSIHSM